MRAYFSLAVLLVVVGCQREAAPVSNAAAPSASGAEAAPLSGTLASARALSRGAPGGFTVGCRARFYVGAFRLERSGESVRIASTARSTTGAQSCGVTAAWVDAQDQVVAPAGFGCPEGDTPAQMDVAYEYSPANGGNSANPVYLRVVRDDPADCAPVTLSLTLR
jgi:hypothetical protein